MEEYIEMISRSYQNGWKAYSKTFIENFGIPKITDEKLEFIKNESEQEKINNLLEKIYFNNNQKQSVLM